MRKLIFIIVFVAVATLGIASFLYVVRPVGGADSAKQTITVNSGEGSRAVADDLAAHGLIRSRSGFYLVSVLTGGAFRIKPGEYEFSAAQNSREILARLVEGPDRERNVLVREGETIYDVDAALAAKNVLPKGALIAAQASSSVWLEGRLFPDTYRFYVSSTVVEVLQRFEKNFADKAEPLLKKDPEHFEQNLILASILEREIPDAHDRQVVAGLLLKREANGMPLQVDATICYIKEMKLAGGPGDPACYPLSSVDLGRTSPYNTYTNRGWPPHPIGNPGAGAIAAALAPLESPYWYYLSDPETGKTIFATTLDEHTRNRVKYLAK